MLYHYFGSKEGLYRASLRHVYGQLSSTEVALADMVLPAEELLERLIRAEYAFLASHPQHVRLLTWENLRRGKAAREADLSSFKAPILEALRIALDRGQREGRFRADVDEKQLLISCLALSFFYFSNQYTLGQALGFDLDDAGGDREAHPARRQPAARRHPGTECGAGSERGQTQII